MTTEHLRFLKKIRRRRRMVVFLRILILFLFLLQWEICADTGVVDSFIFSSPSRIITCFLKMTEDGSVFHHIGITLYETLVSFLLVTLTSILIAILLWCFHGLSEILDPYMVVLNSLPKSALAPLLIVWLGANTTTIVVAGMSVAIFGSILNLYTSFFFFNDTATTEIYTLSLHDALPISPCVGSRSGTAQGAALLTKLWRTAIIKTERAPLLAVGSTRFAQIDYADRLAPPRRSARFYGKCQC